eukprot:Sdes_comp21548_c0_seq1m20165
MWSFFSSTPETKSSQGVSSDFIPISFHESVVKELKNQYEQLEDKYQQLSFDSSELAELKAQNESLKERISFLEKTVCDLNAPKDEETKSCMETQVVSPSVSSSPSDRDSNVFSPLSRGLSLIHLEKTGLGSLLDGFSSPAPLLTPDAGNHSLSSHAFSFCPSGSPPSSSIIP